jgi:hypothetical protein
MVGRDERRLQARMAAPLICWNGKQEQRFAAHCAPYAIPAFTATLDIAQNLEKFSLQPDCQEGIVKKL